MPFLCWNFRNFQRKATTEIRLVEHEIFPEPYFFSFFFVIQHISLFRFILLPLETQLPHKCGKYQSITRPGRFIAYKQLTVLHMNSIASTPLKYFFRQNRNRGQSTGKQLMIANGNLWLKWHHHHQFHVPLFQRPFTATLELVNKISKGLSTILVTEPFD